MVRKLKNTERQMVNMELLADALRTRGFFVACSANRLILQPGAGRSDLWHLQKLLRSLQIEAVCHADTIVLEAVQYTGDLAERISFFKAYNQESWCPQHMRSWKSFVKRRHGYKLDALTLDPGIAYLVKMLSKAGILTEMSCDGHGRRPPCIWFAGGWNAAWFEMVSDKLLSEGKLHYRWLVTEERDGHILTAKKPDSESWSLACVQEDAVKIGAYLDRQADGIRAAKRQCFKYRSMREQAERLSGDYPALKRWMLERQKDAILSKKNSE